MNKFNVVALANTFAIIDIILHSSFRLWILISPESYVNTMGFFVTGAQFKIDPELNLDFFNFVSSTVLEGLTFWVLGAAVGVLYNKLSRS